MCRLVTDYLDKTVNEYPDKTAFIDFKRVITFQELKDEASAIASAIIDRNVFRKPILLFMDKSVSTVSSFIGIAYSGNFYTPVDIKMPDDRIGKILNILDPAIVITDKEHEEQARTIFAGRDIMVFEDEVSRPVLNDRITDVRSRLTDADTLYVFFTSGSTGIPKGVIISHRAAVDYTDWISDCYGFDEKTVFANQAQLYFDASIQDIYAPLRNGSTTLLIPNRLFASPVRAWKEIIRHKANTLFWVPSVLCLFANFDVLSHVEKVPLKTVLFCGEVMPVKQLNYWIENYPDVIYANLYGPTECTDACTYYTIDRKFKDNEALPIGKPCANTEVYVITEEGALADSPGVTGELYISGKCLSDGYYNDPEKTAKAFLPNPFSSNEAELMYKTGDLVFYNEAGELIYVCRKDYQVKIHGYRVELGEIEAAALSVKGVDYCCCLFDQDNEKTILVYTGEIGEDELNDILKTKLQDYMIPSAYKHRETMLFNNSEKIDRIALRNEYI